MSFFNNVIFKATLKNEEIYKKVSKLSNQILFGYLILTFLYSLVNGVGDGFTTENIISTIISFSIIVLVIILNKVIKNPRYMLLFSNLLLFAFIVFLAFYVLEGAYTAWALVAMLIFYSIFSIDPLIFWGQFLTGILGTMLHLKISVPDGTFFASLTGNIIVISFAIIAFLGRKLFVNLLLTEEQNIEKEHKLAEKEHEKTLETQKMVSEMGDISHNLKRLTNEASVMMNEIDGAVEEIAKGSVEQSEEIKDIMENFYVLDGNIEEIITKFNEVHDSLNARGEDYDENERLLHEMQTSNESLKDVKDELNTAVTLLDTEIVGINDILGTIKSVAEQTALLALNASIEAARAGEAGRGFAVVADEIRKLADDTTSSTIQISELVENIVTQNVKVGSSVENLNQQSYETEEKIEAVTSNSLVLSQSVKDIMSQIENLIKLTEEIDVAKNNSKVGVTNASDLAQTFSSAAEQTASSVSSHLKSIEEIDITVNKLEDISGKMEG